MLPFAFFFFFHFRRYVVQVPCLVVQLNDTRSRFIGAWRLLKQKPAIKGITVTYFSCCFGIFMTKYFINDSINYYIHFFKKTLLTCKCYRCFAFFLASLLSCFGLADRANCCNSQLRPFNMKSRCLHSHPKAFFSLSGRNLQ